MKRLSTFLPFFLLFTVFAVDVQAQSRNKYGTHYKSPFGITSATLGVGVAYYTGDLNGKVDMKNLGLGPSLSLGGLFRVTEHLSARGELRFYQVSGGPNPASNLSFKTRNPDLNLGVQADLFSYNRHALINPYLYVGVGVTYINPKAKLNDTWHSLRPLTTEMVAYSRLPLVISGGLGVSVQAFRRLSLGLELNNNFLLSDYLDDVSTVYPAFDQLPSDLARQLSDRTAEAGLPAQQTGWHRGNTKKYDTYLFFQLRATYSLGSKKEAHERKNTRCPKL